MTQAPEALCWASTSCRVAAQMFAGTQAHAMAPRFLPGWTQEKSQRLAGSLSGVKWTWISGSVQAPHQLGAQSRLPVHAKWLTCGNHSRDRQ